MSTTSPSGRHLQREGLEEYLNAGSPAIVVIDGEPSAQLVIEPLDRRLSLRILAPSGEPPDLVGYRHLATDTVTIDGHRWVELSISGDENLLDAYPVLCAVADRVQQDQTPFATAVLDAIASYQQILRSLRRLGDEQETGLYGELLVLEHLLDVIGADHAIAAWRGPSREEHDFGLASSDLEIKTTMSEVRHHWIRGVTQLQPTPDRTLWLVSIQLTAAGDGGRSLPELVNDIRGSLTHQSELEHYDDRLALAGWTEDLAPLVTRQLRLRSTPAIYLVDSGFPALTASKLTAVGLPLERFRQVHYQLDVSGLTGANDPPPQVSGFARREETS